MLRLVKAHFAASGEPNVGDRPPSRFFHFGAGDSFLGKRGYFSSQVITHEIQFVPAVAFRGMNRCLRGRKRENEPTPASVHR